MATVEREEKAVARPLTRMGVAVLCYAQQQGQGRGACFSNYGAVTDECSLPLSVGQVVPDLNIDSPNPCSSADPPSSMSPSSSSHVCLNGTPVGK